MNSLDNDTDELLTKASDGDSLARELLLSRNRNRLKRVVKLRLDQRLTARIDPSDVVQESLLDASQMLPQYLCERPLRFYPWLRQVTLDRLKKVHRYHLQTQRRAVGCINTGIEAKSLSVRGLFSGERPMRMRHFSTKHRLVHLRRVQSKRN